METSGKPEFFPRERLLDLFGIKPKTAANEASRGEGPPFFRVGRRCFYRYDDVVSWITKNPVKTREK